MTARPPAQFARYTAIVCAGATSLALTVAAGSYIVHEMADALQRSNELSGPIGSDERGTPHLDSPAVSDPVLTGGSHQLPAYRSEQPPVNSKVAPAQATGVAEQPKPPELAAEFTLGGAYLGARITEPKENLLSITVDTNAITMLLGAPAADPDRHAAGATRLRTDLDTHNGEVQLDFSDPTLGRHTLRLDRRTAPAGQSSGAERITADREETRTATVESPAAGQPATRGPAAARSEGTNMRDADRDIAASSTA